MPLPNLLIPAMPQQLLPYPTPTASPKQISLLRPLPPRPNNPLLIYLPGMDGTGKLLYRQLDSLSHFFDIRCLTIPGHDRSDWHELVNQVVRLIEKEVRLIPRPLYLCGESFGGCLALKLVERSPALAHRIILINPASSFPALPWLRWGSHLSHWVPDLLYQWSTHGFLPFLAATERLTPGDRQFLLNTLQSIPSQTSAWRLSLLGAFSVNMKALKHVHQQVLLIASAADQLLPSVEEAHRLSQYFPNIQQVTLPHSGHACLLEAAVNLATILKKHSFVTNSNVGNSTSPVTSHHDLNRLENQIQVVPH